MAPGDETRDINVTPIAPLPPKLADPRPILLVGTGLWLAAAALLAVSGSPGLTFWTCVCGGGLGFIGLGIVQWQRWAYRRGSRWAQRLPGDP